MPLALAQARTGQGSNVPVAVTSTVFPHWPPEGKSVVNVGGAAAIDDEKERSRRRVRIDGDQINSEGQAVSRSGQKRFVPFRGCRIQHRVDGQQQRASVSASPSND